MQSQSGDMPMTAAPTVDGGSLESIRLTPFLEGAAAWDNS